MDGDTCYFLSQSDATFRRWAEGGRKQAGIRNRTILNKDFYVQKKSQCVPMYVFCVRGRSSFLFFATSGPGRKGERSDDGGMMGVRSRPSPLQSARSLRRKIKVGFLPILHLLDDLFARPIAQSFPAKSAAGGGAPSKPVLMHPGGKRAILRVG